MKVSSPEEKHDTSPAGMEEQAKLKIKKCKIVKRLSKVGKDL
jgi:hypothetical protein